MNNEELPSTPDGIVPDKLPAVRLVRLAPDTAPKEADHVPEVTVPVVVRLDEPASGEAPMVLKLIVRAAEPLNEVPEASPVPPLLNVTALATEPAEPVVFWFSVGTSAAWIADIRTFVPLPRRYCPDVTAPASELIAAWAVV
jgi:hypothetical protein